MLKATSNVNVITLHIAFLGMSHTFLETRGGAVCLGQGTSATPLLRHLDQKIDQLYAERSRIFNESLSKLRSTHALATSGGFLNDPEVKDAFERVKDRSKKSGLELAELSQAGEEIEKLMEFAQMFDDQQEHLKRSETIFASAAASASAAGSTKPNPMNWIREQITKALLGGKTSGVINVGCGTPGCTTCGGAEVSFSDTPAPNSERVEMEELPSNAQAAIGDLMRKIYESRKSNGFSATPTPAETPAEAKAFSIPRGFTFGGRGQAAGNLADLMGSLGQGEGHEAMSRIFGKGIPGLDDGQQFEFVSASQIPPEMRAIFEQAGLDDVQYIKLTDEDTLVSRQTPHNMDQFLDLMLKPEDKKYPH